MPVYWVVDLETGAVEVRGDPGRAGYRTLRTLRAGETLASPCEGVGELAVDELLRGVGDAAPQAD